MGTMTMQFGKLSGFEVWTVCRPHNFDIVKKHDADEVWDYNDPTVTQYITDAAARHPNEGIKL